MCNMVIGNILATSKLRALALVFKVYEWFSYLPFFWRVLPPQVFLSTCFFNLFPNLYILFEQSLCGLNPSRKRWGAFNPRVLGLVPLTVPSDCRTQHFHQGLRNLRRCHVNQSQIPPRLEFGVLVVLDPEKELNLSAAWTPVYKSSQSDSCIKPCLKEGWMSTYLKSAFHFGIILCKTEKSLRERRAFLYTLAWFPWWDPVLSGHSWRTARLTLAHCSELNFGFCSGHHFSTDFQDAIQNPTPHIGNYLFYSLKHSGICT